MTIEGAIAELQNLIKADDVPFYYNGAIQKVIETIIDECKPKVGKWLWQLADNGWADHICSVCGYTKNTDIHVSLGWRYCPNCGSKMERKTDE